MKKSILTFIAFTFFSTLSAEQISFKAESMSGTAGNSNSKTVLQGNANVITESMEITADKIEMSGEEFRYITATGKITGINKQSKMEFTCNKMTYDRTTKIATLQDKVHLVDTQNEVSADAEIIEYNQNTEIAVMQINVSLKQKDNNCTGAYAIYRKNEQLLDLSGNPQIQQGKDTFRAQNIRLNMDTQEITLSGRVQGSVTTEAKKNTPKTEENQTEAKEENTNE